MTTDSVWPTPGWAREFVGLSPRTKEGKPVASPQAAAEAFQKSIAILEKLVAEQADAPEYRDRLAASYENLANLRADHRDAKAGRAAIDKAIDLQRSTLVNDPTNRIYALEQGNHLSLRARINFIDQRLDDVAHDAEELLALAVDGPEPYLVTAKTIADCASGTSTDRSLSQSVRESRLGKFTKLGGRLIEAAVDREPLGRFGLETLDDAKFDSIRDDPSFKNARAKLERRIEENKTSAGVKEG